MYEFPQNNLLCTPIFITGVCRTGKTSIARLLSTFENVEYLEEPWSLLTIPILAGLGLMPREIAKSTFKADFYERVNDLILCRNANFRPSDLSTIWLGKNPKEIFHRLTNINTREEVINYLNGRKSKVICVLPEILPFIDFLKETFPGCKIIHVTKHPYDVAQKTLEKGWFNNQRLLQPKDNILHWKFNDYFLPWWVEKEDGNLYLKLNEWERGIYYSQSILEKNQLKRSETEKILADSFLHLKIEDFFDYTSITLEKLKNFISSKTTERTSLVLGEVYPSDNNVDLGQWNILEKSKINKLCQELGYHGS